MSLTKAAAGSCEQHSLMNILQAWAAPFPHLSSPNSSFWINSFLTKHTVSAYIRVSHYICNHLFRWISSSHKVRSLRAETVLFIFITKPNVSRWICTYFYWKSEWTMGKKKHQMNNVQPTTISKSAGWLECSDPQTTLQSPYDLQDPSNSNGPWLSDSRCQQNSIMLFKVWVLIWSQGHQCSFILISLGDYLCFKAIPLQILFFQVGGFTVAKERWTVMGRKRLRYEHLIT